MKIVKHYWFIAIALIAMISFSSCESDEERGFDISGLYGKTWWAKWDLKIHTESRFTVTSDSPRGLLQLMA